MTTPSADLPPSNLPAMSDPDLARLRSWLKSEVRKAQSLLAHVEREQKNRRRRRACH